MTLEVRGTEKYLHHHQDHESTPGNASNNSHERLVKRVTTLDAEVLEKMVKKKANLLLVRDFRG